MKRLNSLTSLRGPADTGRLSGAKKGSKGASSVVTFHVFVGKSPPPRGLFTNLRESIKEAKSINQPDAKPGIKKPRPREGPHPGLFLAFGLPTTATVAGPRHAEIGRAFDRKEGGRKA